MTRERTHTTASGHEGHDEHEVRFHGKSGLRSSSPLDTQTESVVSGTIGAAIEVHRQLGPGLFEAIYVDALTIELAAIDLRFEREHCVVVEYKGIPLRPYRLDLVVEGRVVVEVKAVARLEPVHEAQVLSYLRATGLRVGLLMNFNAPLLTRSLRRFVV